MRRYIANVTASPYVVRAAAEVLGTQRRFAVLLVIAFLAGLIGPFGTTAGFFDWERYLYWLLIVFGTAIPVHLVFFTFDRFIGQSAWRDAVWIPAVSLVAALPATAMVAAIARLFGSRLDMMAVAGLYAQCAFAILAIATIMHLVSGSSKGLSAQGARVPILSRLPGARRGRLIRLTAQDHYVEVVTDRGRSLVAMRFRDAVAEVGPTEGAQVHRSHWVAADAVTARRTVDGSLRLYLADGSTVPIGRTFRQKARAAGVLF